MTENQTGIAKEAILRGKEIMKELAAEKVVNFVRYRDLKNSIRRMEKKIGEKK